MNIQQILAMMKDAIINTKDKGMDDTVPVNLSGGEYVFDADTVASLGDGNSEKGAEVLDLFRTLVRQLKENGGEQPEGIAQLLQMALENGTKKKK